ncbi:MAG: HAMP domain-containing sensor histidine kinase [Spirochaetota bacterium]
MLINPEHTKIELNTRTIRHIVIAFEKMYGKKELTRFFNKTGLPVEYLTDENNWISYDYFIKVLNDLVEYSGDPEITFKFGLTTAANSSWGIIKTILKSFTSCTYAYKKVITLNPRWSKAGTFQFVEFKKNKAIIQMKITKGYKQDKYNCLSIQGQLASIPTIWGLPPAEIKETQCSAEGADSCIYELSWKNPPKKKTGLYSFIAGTILSIILYLTTLTGKIDISRFSDLNYIILPVLVMLGSIAIGKRAILKRNFKKTEEYNNEIEKNLIETEKSNEILQEGVERKAAQLTGNIEDLKQKIAHQKKNADQMLRSEKMDSVGRIAVNMANAHRKLLDTIHANLESLLKDSRNDESVLDSLKGAQRAANKCEDIIDHLLSFQSEEKSIAAEEIDLNIILNNCIAKAQKEFAEYRFTISGKLKKNLPKVKADYSLIEQVFMIIISNGADAILEREKESKKKAKKDGEILIKTSLKGSMVCTEISDNGTGMTKDTLLKVFDPFFTTKATSRKRGMGLTLSYNAVKKAGGYIDVKSAPGTGSTFFVYLPATETIK